MSQVRLGDYAFALGTPLGLQGSVTMGIVSAINREVPASGSLGTLDLIQTDAAISPGNSGGALADAEGRVIGINVAAADIQTRAQNIGFAIPADTVVNVVDQIVETGRVRYGYLGIQTTTITASLQQQYDLGRARGALVVQVEPGSPAARAGVEQGDIIVQIGDRPVDTEVDLFAYLRRQKPGQTVKLTIVRDSKERTLRVTLDERPST
jgi:S1-C subfamily serine protease